MDTDSCDYLASFTVFPEYPSVVLDCVHPGRNFQRKSVSFHFNSLPPSFWREFFLFDLRPQLANYGVLFLFDLVPINYHLRCTLVT